MAFCWPADAAGPSLNARMITDSDFSGDPDQNCCETLHFCDISGGGRLDPRMSYGGESLTSFHFYCCSHCIRGLSNYAVLSRRTRTSRRKKSVADNIYMSGASHCVVSLSKKIKQNQGHSQRILSCYQKMKN